PVAARLATAGRGPSLGTIERRLPADWDFRPVGRDHRRSDGDDPAVDGQSIALSHVGGFVLASLLYSFLSDPRFEV
ncbi:hypothetical protein ACFQE1_18225, partial [Halobium palmae]